MKENETIKLTGFTISGHSLFEDNTYFGINAVGQNTKLNKKKIVQFNPFLKLNRTIAIVGINATGKSTLMDIFSGLYNFYIMNLSIDQTSLNGALRGDDTINIVAQFATSGQTRYEVRTCFSKEFINGTLDEDEQPVTKNYSGKSTNWVVTSEQVYQSILKPLSSKQYFSFSEKDLIMTRNDLKENERKLLSNKDSIFRAVDKPLTWSPVFTTVPLTDQNVVKTFSDQTPNELLQYLDKSIEYLKYEKNSEGKTTGYVLKFKDAKDPVTVLKFSDISRYLSSGTVKGITLFFEVISALRSGATLFVDEIELHINKQIVRDFINFFGDPEVNKQGATLVYSTHYVELIDDLSRKDEVYLLTRDNKTKVQRLSDIPNVRTELKKSEFFYNNNVKGTSPSYNRMMSLRQSIIDHNEIFGNAGYRTTIVSRHQSETRK